MAVTKKSLQIVSAQYFVDSSPKSKITTNVSKHCFGSESQHSSRNHTSVIRSRLMLFISLSLKVEHTFSKTTKLSAACFALLTLNVNFISIHDLSNASHSLSVFRKNN